MKHLRKFENTYLDGIDRLSKKYKDNFLNKIVILKFKDKENFGDMCIGKIQDFTLDGSFIIFDIYDYDDYYAGYQVTQTTLDISDFDILGAYDNVKDAEKDLKILSDSKKYNL